MSREQKRVLSERTYDTEEAPGLEHGAAIPEETDNERESTGDDKNVGDHLDDIGVRFVLENREGAMRIRIARAINIHSAERGIQGLRNITGIPVSLLRRDLTCSL